jgi:hypothetical protein
VALKTLFEERRQTENIESAIRSSTKTYDAIAVGK